MNQDPVKTIALVIIIGSVCLSATTNRPDKLPRRLPETIRPKNGTNKRRSG